jgi:hypothetical protein
VFSWFEAVVLGLVQGLTEFLPISSSAHLRIVSELAGWEDPGAAFTAVTQLGTSRNGATHAEQSGRVVQSGPERVARLHSSRPHGDRRVRSSGS